MLLAGLVGAVLTGVFGIWNLAAIVGWIVACATYVVWVWLHLWRLDAAALRSHATREDPGLVATDLLITCASIASLAAVVLVLASTRDADPGQRAVAGGIALLSVALSWALIHTLFAQRYAREYYGEPEGGIDFPADDGADPVFSDFAYVAFDLGMTYQISDTTVKSTRMRRLVLRHTLLSYLFGTVILASTINLVVGLGS